MQQEQSVTLNRSLVFLLTIAVIIFLIEKLGTVLASLGNIVLLLALAWLLTYTLRPVVRWFADGVIPKFVVAWARRRNQDRLADLLERLRLPYGGAVAVVYLLLLTILVFFVLNLIPIVIDQVNQLSTNIEEVGTNLPSSILRIQEWFFGVRETLIRDFNIDPAQIALPENIVGQVGSAVTSLGQFILDLASGVITFFGQVLIVFLFSALIMIDGSKVSEQLMHLLPDDIGKNLGLPATKIDQAIGGFIQGTLIQALIYGTVVTLLMWIFGLQFALAAGLVTGLLMLIPFFGGLIGLLLPLTIGLLQSSPNTLVLIIILFIFQQILFNIVMPRILSHSLHMPTLLVFISLSVGVQLLGIWGLVFAVPAAAAFYSIAQELLHRAKFHTSIDSAHPHE